jgi:seryl-tRNA synthetase
MPSARAQDSIIRDIEGLIEADDRNPETQQEVAKERQGLVSSVSEIKTLKGRQQELTAQRQEVTQQLGSAFQRGKDAAISYRSAVRAKIGPRNERLVQYKIAPLRKRSRKTKVVFVKETGGEASGTKPDAVASPPAKPVD